jgi:hypothetical protein
VNDIPCKDCVYFELLLRGTSRGQRDTQTAICAAKSTYPAETSDTQVFHPLAKRAAPEELPVVVTIDAKGTVKNCIQAIRKGR